MIPTNCLLLIDDHRILIDGLRQTLLPRFKDLPIEAAGSVREALELDVQPSLLVLDIQLPGINGLDGLSLLRQRWPQARILVLSTLDDAQTRERALLLGAEGFVSKTEPASYLADLLEGILLDRRPLSRRAVTTTGADYLTPRQCEVLDLLCCGQANKVIARHLGVSDNTVRRHLQDIFTFLGVNNRTEAVIEARRRGLVR
ncbi:MAG: response regulator transcription factor [Marinospirillum sp.]|uniref:response regulator n=1 Tax=Marinospirillum sp. TaxID=2183934 RepID=UPI0019EB9602|nr:response regulator transcription factor [Marinospirillum sp.]MBE0506224.1 response regulator transcription factor [Marinospirillum sp.]